MRFLVFLVLPVAIVACAAPPVQRSTLRDLDVTGGRPAAPAARSTSGTPEDIRRAYLEYLRHASSGDKSRVDALQRLAQLEFQLNEARARETGTPGTDSAGDDEYRASIDRNIELLQTLLRDHPGAANTDRTLYQLARAYDQRGLGDRSMEALDRLVQQYPKSPHYAESKFRLAERAFIRGQYSTAEDLYTDVLVSRNNGPFREKARYKRGWARFKQNFYREAVDDFVDVIDMNDFDDLARVPDVERNNYDEYLRALGLSFVYLGEPDALQQYFRERPGFRQIPQTYFRVSDLFLADQRFADAAAVLEQFHRNYPQSPYLSEAALRRVNVWATSGFHGNFARALEDFYTAYQPQSSYWSRPGASPQARSEVLAALRNHLLLASSRAHKEYQANKKESAFESANTWYQRYLHDYPSHTRKDNVHFLYAELLAQHGNHAEALRHYEQAGFDGDIIVNPDAAYAAISTAARLRHGPGEASLQNAYLAKLIHYSRQYVRLYPGNKQSLPVMTRAAEEAYRDGLHQQAVELAELINAVPYTDDTYNLHSLKAHSYFRLGRYQDAEAGYLALLQNYKPAPKTRSQIVDNLAISIYNQATAARSQGAVADALGHYARMAELAPASEITATGLYEAVVLVHDSKMWPETIAYTEKFQKLFPAHKLAGDVSRKLSVAYLNTNQGGAAASQLIKAAHSDEDVAYKTAALWKAAELYAADNNVPAAIKAFEEYATTYPQPYPENLEAMHRLTELHARNRDPERANHWRGRILESDRRTAVEQKTGRTNFVSSLAALSLARQEHEEFVAIRLALPLERSLARKKAALQKALDLYGQAASYGIAETATAATFGIAEVYRSFSKALLESERPRHLGAAELEQYKILLEDQAFPFEDNAIKFYEKNLSHIRQGVSNEWTQKSLQQLRQLYPARYGRTAMLEPFINVLH